MYSGYVMDSEGNSNLLLLIEIDFRMDIAEKRRTSLLKDFLKH